MRQGLGVRGQLLVVSEQLSMVSSDAAKRRWGFVIRSLWVVNLVFVVGALLYFGAVWGAAILEWLDG